MMQRTKTIKKPDAILTSDMHLREDAPLSFSGNWDKEQWDAVDEVAKLQTKFNCIVLHPGDLFHRWKPSPQLITQAILHLPKQFYTVYGQHDLPQHNLKLKRKTGLRTLEAAKIVTVLQEASWGQEPNKGSLLFPNREPDRYVAVWHHMTYMTSPYPGATDGNAKAILRKYPKFDLIVTGDNHDSFYIEFNGRLLVNPGPLTRQNAKQIDYKPRVYLWYADTNTVEPYYIPYTKGSISREHIKEKEDRKDRIDSFVSHLDSDWEAEFTFLENLKRFKENNMVRKSVMEIIYKSMEKNGKTKK